LTEENRQRAGRRLGEAAVIVTSILLAFSIEALWAQQQMRDEEREALAGLVEEFTTNLEQLDRVITRHESSRGWVERLVALPEDSIRALSQTSISEMMLATGNPWTFEPVLGTTDALMAAGRLGVIRNVRLREALTSFKNVVSDSEEDADFLRSFAVDVWKAQVPHGGPWTDPATEIGHLGPITLPDFVRSATAEDLLNVRSDRTHMGMVGLFYLNVGYYKEELLRIRTEVSTILELLGESP
jgi:hypothetical protein